MSKGRRLISGAVLAPASSPLCPDVSLFPLTAPPTSSSQSYYVSGTARICIRVDILFQFPAYFRRCSESIREKNEEGPYHPSARSKASSLQVPR